MSPYGLKADLSRAETTQVPFEGDLRPAISQKRPFQSNDAALRGHSRLCVNAGVTRPKGEKGTTESVITNQLLYQLSYAGSFLHTYMKPTACPHARLRALTC